ncbi:hypothetical protein Q5M85_01660 [Paraclostridium bifermentans]|nr:hypothetical protein [Paraclostridium bifermentans]
MEKEKTCNLLKHTENLKFKLILESTYNRCDCWSYNSTSQDIIRKSN